MRVYHLPGNITLYVFPVNLTGCSFDELTVIVPTSTTTAEG